MEEFLAGKPEAQVIRGLQALLPFLLEFWNEPGAFRKAGTATFMREAGLPREDAPKAFALVDQAQKQATRLRSRQFRVFRTQTALEQAYMRLVPTATESPARQGFLWLAFRVQKAAIEYLESEQGAAALTKVEQAVEGNKEVFHALQAEPEALSFSKIEAILHTLALRTLDEKTTAFQINVMGTHMMEVARAEGRLPPDQDLMMGEKANRREEVRMLASMIEPMHAAELNEANHRFFRSKESEKGRLFDLLRKFLARYGPALAKFGPRGFEKYCQALEAQLFPYPAPLEWMRSYLKPLYTNAQQSTVFDNCLTEAAIKQRYDKMMGEKSANAVMLDLARAFALGKLNKLQDPDQQDFLETLDLQAEFQWPTSIQELKDAQKA